MNPRRLHNAMMASMDLTPGAADGPDGVEDDGLGVCSDMRADGRGGSDQPGLAKARRRGEESPSPISVQCSIDGCRALQYFD